MFCIFVFPLSLLYVPVNSPTRQNSCQSLAALPIIFLGGSGPGQNSSNHLTNFVFSNRCCCYLMNRQLSLPRLIPSSLVTFILGRKIIPKDEVKRRWWWREEEVKTWVDSSRGQKIMGTMGAEWAWAWNVKWSSDCVWGVILLSVGSKGWVNNFVGQT